VVGRRSVEGGQSQGKKRTLTTKHSKHTKEKQHTIELIERTNRPGNPRRRSTRRAMAYRVPSGPSPWRISAFAFFSCVSSVSWLTLLRFLPRDRQKTPHQAAGAFVLCQQQRGISRQAANPQPDRNEGDLTAERTENREGMHGADRAVRLGGAAKPCRAWPAFRFRVLPFLPWTILFDDGLGLPITFEAD
jgi:hypothetical protein